MATKGVVPTGTRGACRGSRAEEKEREGRTDAVDMYKHMQNPGQVEWVPLNIIPFNKISRLLSYKPEIQNLSHTFYSVL